MSLHYPTVRDLEAFMRLALRSKFVFLPPMDAHWVAEMQTMFLLVQMIPGCVDRFSLAAANLFFKIIKNHRRIDGNKRSAICCLILFIALNERNDDITGSEIEQLALEVSSSKGNTGNIMIPRLEDIFEKRTWKV